MAVLVSLFSMSFYSGMKAHDSAMPAGHSAKSQKPAALYRNRVLPCSGTGCFLPPELGAAMQRILQCQQGAGDKVQEIPAGQESF